ncbi:molybdopterin synthase catalytic subunit MoaE [Aliidiomarina taiwanensis]|uniref:Molybdopterin synthase catalytic subunit n=1 Tax=Aliidiomarina taiwanensis TaxID=946228 RepID=A0A432X799_9GAMM|nr:molybdopterin synthase catalytic subunit MoaE [Aliidiomarina taiwanensis]RUO42728.1 molybdopterin synthase catalytic subunit MoaE [Aliidiomarina taiwanensis]
MIDIAVQTHDFDMAALYQKLSRRAAHGAVVTFTGLVREVAGGDLTHLSLEHYPGMTEQALQDIAEQAKARWPVGEIIIVHRVGTLALNEQIVFVGVSSAHRKQAFAAAEFLMDYLKTRAPFWKKEHTTTGERWVEAKKSDEAAASRWQQREVEP